jgi:putative ABC transport system permease protein
MHDIMNALRQLTRRPGATAAVVATLALGIGANALVFSAVRGVLLRPLPFEEPDRLVALWETQPGIEARSVAPANFLDWRSAQGFEGLAAYDRRTRSLAGDDPQRVSVATVSANFFDVLRVHAILGRTFTAPLREGGVREIVLGEGFWRSRFSGDRSILGRTLRLDDETLVIVGVVPARLAFPEEVVAWTQAPHDIPELGGVPVDIRTVRDAWYFRVIGRLKPGISIPHAQSEMDTIAARLREAHPSTNRNAGVSVVDLHAQITGVSARMLWTLLGVAACVLAVACGNVATLLLAAAVGRTREMRIRTALGASPARLARQLTVESLALALCGGAAGLALAWMGRPAMVALLPPATPRADAIDIDLTVIVFTGAVAVLTAVLFGTAPALMSARADAPGGLRDGRGGRSRSAARLASALVAAQLAAALVLVTGTGLMLKTLWTLYERDVAIDVEKLLTLNVSLPDARTRGRAAAAGDIQRMVERLAVLPGVIAAAAVQTLPLAARGPSANIRVEGRSFPPNEAPDVVWKTVTPGYFTAVGARIIRGRGFTEADREGRRPVTVINRTLARLLWPDGDPIGTRIGTGLDGDGAPVVVIGIVDDTPQEGLGTAVLPEMYRPIAQPARFGLDAMSFVVRTDGDPARLAAAARQAVREVHPHAPVSAIRPMTTVANASVASETTAMRALAIFGGLALVLAAVGLYGVMARLVGDRGRELGVRLALGAAPGAVRRLVLMHTVKLAAAGIAAGGLLSVVLSGYLRAWLHGVSAVDPLVVTVAAAVLLGAALLASYLPARRASRIDPLVVLKGD